LKRLIVNADDYGRTPGITDGILQAHREGIVTSTTAMINMPYVEEALRLADEYPELGVGIHLVFTAGRPVLPPEKVPSLVDAEGRFYKPEALYSRLDQVDTGQLKMELEAQIERFMATGRRPDHLDCHHPVHIYPPFFAVILELAEAYGLPMRMPLPPVEELEKAGVPAIAPDLPPKLLYRMVTEDWRLLGEKRVSYPDHFIGGFYGEEALTLKHLLAILGRLPEGTTEMMTHPGKVDEVLLAQSSYTWQREEEIELLCHPRVKGHLKELGIELVNFRVLALN